MVRKSALCLGLFVAALAAMASAEGFELEDTVSVVAIDRDLVAHGANGRTSKLRLELGERLRWSGSRGRIGFAVSNRRVFGFRATRGWSERALRAGEVSPDRPEIGPRLALFVTSQRAFAYDGQWREESIGPQEVVSRSSVGSRVALVVTSRRALGVAAGGPGFVPVRLGIHERIESARTLASSAELTTSQRLLFYSGSGGGWSERDRTRY
jgi:hypothetical protein